MAPRSAMSPSARSGELVRPGRREARCGERACHQALRPRRAVCRPRAAAVRDSAARSSRRHRTSRPRLGRQPLECEVEVGSPGSGTTSFAASTIATPRRARLLDHDVDGRGLQLDDEHAGVDVSQLVRRRVAVRESPRDVRHVRAVFVCEMRGERACWSRGRYRRTPRARRPRPVERPRPQRGADDGHARPRQRAVAQLPEVRARTRPRPS